MPELQFLLLEANLPDVELLQATLTAGGLDYQLLQAVDQTEFVHALTDYRFDLILADYLLPDFGGMAALEMAQALCPETPLVFVSQSVGEELAVEALEKGATGYVFKQRLARLVPAVQRALQRSEVCDQIREQGRRALKVSEAKYRKLFESIDEGFCICEMLFDAAGKPQDYRFLEVNSVLSELTGLEQPLGKTMRELIPELEDSWFEIYGDVVRTGQPVRFEQQSAAMNRWFNVNAFCMGESQRNQFGVLFTNITAQKQTEQERERFWAVGSDLEVINGSDGYFQWVSSSFEQTLGWTPAEMIARPWAEFVHPDDISASSSETDSLFLGRQTLKFENRYRHKDGSYRWLLWNAQSYPDEQVVYAAAVDITDRKTAELEREQLLQREQSARAEAEAANRVKDEFLAVLSHELRSPLNPILGWAQLLQTGRLDPARQTEAVKTIERNARLQSQLIEDLLDISRIMQGKLSLTPAPVSLAFVIAAAVETVHLAAEAKQVQIRLELAETAPIFGDAARLQQVIWNLLTNAVKFTASGGQVTVELRQQNQRAQIRVTDTGKGIQPQFLPYVFEYFRQEDGSTTRKFGGLGLGLAIVKQIVEMHGGTVSAESPGENQGTSFTVELPISQQAMAVCAPTSPSSLDPKALSNLSILLVDDDTDTREFQAFLLEQSGATVVAVASGVAALQILDHLSLNLLVSDLGMAEMDGYMLIQQIRARPAEQGGNIPAIAVTAYAGELDQEKTIRAGFQAYLTKPLQPEVLVRTITELLNGSLETSATPKDLSTAAMPPPQLPLS